MKATVASIVTIVLALVMLGGWIMNIVKIFNHFADPLTGGFVLRVIGVLVFPVGAVLGFL